PSFDDALVAQLRAMEMRFPSVAAARRQLRQVEAQAEALEREHGFRSVFHARTHLLHLAQWAGASDLCLEVCRTLMRGLEAEPPSTDNAVDRLHIATHLALILQRLGDAKGAVEECRRAMAASSAAVNANVRAGLVVLEATALLQSGDAAAAMAELDR